MTPFVRFFFPFYYYYFFFEEFPPALWLKNARCGVDTYPWVLPLCCTTCCACCMPCFCLSSWEFGLLLLHHRPLSLFFFFCTVCCCWRREALSSSLQKNSVFGVWLFRCYWSVCGYRGCVIATLFWLLTVSLPPMMHVGSVFIFVFPYPLMHLAWAVFCMYCSSVSSPLFSSAIRFFMSPPPFLSSFTPNTATHLPLLSLHVSIAVIFSILIILSRMFFHFVCYQDTQPALVWMHNIKALHFNEQLFKASFGGMLWLCMYRSFNIRVFLV